MARWYSKQRKQRMNGDFLKYGFIPGRGRIALEQKPCHFASHLDLCEFTGDCDFCNHARKDDGVWRKNRTRLGCMTDCLVYKIGTNTDFFR